MFEIAGGILLACFALFVLRVVWFLVVEIFYALS